MTVISAISQCQSDAYGQLVRELQTEFRCADVGALADRVVEAEAADFYWEARVRERYLGHDLDGSGGLDEGDEELVRVAFMSLLAESWHVGSCIVDGEGRAVDLLWIRHLSGLEEAEIAFERAV